MQRVKISLLCLLSLSLAGVLVAQTAVDPNSDVGSASLQNLSGGATLRGTYFDVRYMSNSGVGYQNGYTQIGAFTPFWLNEDAFIAPNTRLLVTDNSRVGLNTGLVARQYSSGSDRIYGINGYFDSDQTAFGNRYQQVTLGMETLGTNWDFRANGYFAMGTTDRFLNEICVSGNPFFVGNQIAFLGTQRREESLTGGDVEFGVPVTRATPWLRAYAGMYGYQSNASKEPIGVRARLEAWVSDDLSIGVNVTDDRQFGTNVNAVVDFRFSGFKPTRYFPQWTTRDRMLMPVQRNWRVATDTYVQNINIAASQTPGGPAYFVTHIDNSAPAGGDGSIEHPFNTLPASAPGANLILVARGTTTEAAPLFGSIALADNQRLLGEGKAHTAAMFATYGGCTVNGNFVLPGFTNSGNYPFLSSAGPNPIITLANNNEVAGFNLLNTLGGANAIGNTVAGSNNFLLQCLEISGNSGRGISLTNATGTGIIRGINLMSGSTDHFNPGGLGDNANGGILVNTGAAGLNLALTNVAMNSNPAVQLFGINLLADNGPLTTTLTNVQANGIALGFGNTNAGIILGETGQTLTATLTNVSASNNTGIGVQVTGTVAGGTINLTSDSLTANGNGLDNLQIGSQAAPLLGATFTGNISNSFFNNSQGGSGIVYSQSGVSAGINTLNLTNIQANGNTNAPGLGGDGLGLFGAAAATMNVNVHDSFLTSNTRDGIHVEQLGGSTINLLVDPTDVRFNGRDGLFFDLAGASTLNVASHDNLLDHNNRSTVHGVLNTASIVNLGTALATFNNNTGNFSGADGLFLDANGGSTANLFISNGTFANSGRLVAGSDGVHIHSDASTVNLTMTGTPANNTPLPPAGTQRDGLFLDIQNASTFTGSVTNGNFTNSLVNGLHATFAGGSQASLILDNTSLSNSGADGMNVTLTGATTVAAITLQNGSLNDKSGQNGLDFNVTAGHLIVNATGSSFTNSGASGVGAVRGSGILGVISTAGLVDLNFTNTPITGSFNNGMFVTATGGSDIRGVFSNSSFNGNGLTTTSTTELDGIRLDLTSSPNSSLQLTNGSTVNGNGGDGFELIAKAATTFTGDFQATTSFSDNGQNAASLARRGVSATVDNSTVGLTFNAVNIHNTLPNLTQQIGFQFDVQNHGTLTAGFTGGDLSNNTLNAFNGSVTGAPGLPVTSATVNLSGTVGNSSGADGAVLLDQAGGQLTFNLANASSINKSGGAGLVGTVNGTGSILNVALSGSTIDNSATFGAFLNATAGGTLNFNGNNTSSISSSGGAGVLVTSTGANSVANFGFGSLALNDKMALNDNGLSFGGAGFNGAALIGGTLNVCLDNSTVTGNANQGIKILVDGANSLANFGVATSAIDNNSSEGLLVDVSNLGVLNYRSQNSSYSNNGANGVFDGVHATVTGTGAADTATARFLFSGDTVNTNTGNGFQFDAANGATLVTSIANGTSASNNVAGYGLNFNATGTNTKAYLLMTGNNLFNGNGLGPVNLNIASGINTAVLSLSGSFNNSPGDGIHIDLNNITNAVVAIQGPGTINGSGQAPVATPAGNGDGIDVRMTNITNGSILIDGLTSINTSAADGIHLELTNVTNGAIRIDGTTAGANTTIGGSGGDGINISLVNTNLVDNLNTTLGAQSVKVLTLASNVATPLNNCLPDPVLTTLNGLGLVPTQALTINAMNISGSAGQGINIHSPNTSNSTIATATLSNNVVVNSTGGDGVHFDLSNTPITTLNITANQVGNSRDNGVNFGLNNSPIGTLNINGNQIGQTIGGGGSPLSDSLPLILPGFNSNTLAANDDGSTGLTPLGFNANFFGTTYNSAYVNNNGNITFTGPLSGFTPFNLLTTATPIIAPFFGDVDTRSGNPVTYGTGIVGGRPAFGVNWLGVRHFSAAGGGANGLPDNTFQLVMVDRGDVAPGAFDFEYNYQQIRWESGTASGGNALGLGGSSARAGYSNGVATALELPGSAVNGALLDTGPAATSLIQNSLNSIHPGRFIFFARNGGIGGASPNGADGILLNAQNGSNIGAMTIDSNTITNNALNGIEVVANNSTLPGPGAPVIISNNTITSQVAGDGFRLVNPNTGVVPSPIGLTFRDNTISTNGGSGINVQLTNAERADVAINSVTTGNHISGNTGFGVHLDGQNTAQINLAMGGAGAANVLDANHDAGVGINLVNATTGSITVANSTFSNTTNGANALFNGGGMEVRLADTATVTPFTIGDAVLHNTTFSGNAANGFNLLLNDNSTASNLLIQNISSLQNAQNQVHIDRHANSIVNVTMNDSTLTGSATSLDGFSYNATNFATATPLAINLNRNTISTNRDGVAIDTSANAVVVANIIENTISNDRNSGIRVTTLNASSFGDPTNGTASQLLGNTISNNGTADGAAGIRLIAQDVSFQNVLIGASGATRSTLTGNFDGIRISDSSFTNPFSTPDNNYQIQATSIVDSRNDGIRLDLSGAGTRVYIGDPTAAATAARNDVVISRTVPAPGGTGYGINVNATGGANNVSIRNATIAYSGLSGVNVAQTGGDLTFNMQATNVLFSGERGLFANITGNSGTTGNNYNVGGTGANEGVLIQNSGQQGILFRTQSPISVSALRDLGTQTYPGGAQNDPNTPNIIRARLNIVNSQIIANGTVGNVNSDGVVLAVGTNTQQDVLMAGNAINGNVLDDVRIFSFASQNTQNDSVDNPVAVAGPNDLLRLDPIARLGLVFGSIQSTYNSTTVPPMTNPQTVPLIPQGLFPMQAPSPIVLATRNTGEQINVTTTGNAGTAGIANSNGTFTTGGTFTNAGRSSSMNGQVQISKFPGPGSRLSDTSTFGDSLNQFVQFGVEQNVDAAFFGGGFNLNPANVFP